MADPVEIEIPERKGGQARRILLRRLIDYIALPSSQVAPQDRSMGGDILLDMLFHATDDDRQLCANRLATMNEAPRRVLRYLAQCKLEIATPMLEQNEAFNSSDLLEIIDHVTTAHRLLIANRKRVPISVCDRLAENGETSVVVALLNNKHAEFSEIGIDSLIGRSRREDEFVNLLIQRPELKPGQAMAMFWWADRDTRRAILQRHAASRMEMVDMCSDVFSIAAEEGWQDPVARKALQLIERRQRNRAALARSEFESLEDAIAKAAEGTMTPDLVQEIGYLAGIKPITAAKIMTDRGGEGIAVLCKATGLKKPSLRNIWLSLNRPLIEDNGTASILFEYLLETYDLLSVVKAQTTLRYWNWSLYTARQSDPEPGSQLEGKQANDESTYSASRRTASLVFGT